MILISKIALTYFAIVLGLLLCQNRLIFRPTRNFVGYPRDVGLNAEDVFFTTQDEVRLHGWLFVTEQEAPYLLFCHGNAGNISDRLLNVKLLLEVPLNVFIFDYRGYGKSEGKPTENGVYTDARAAWDYLHLEIGVPSKQIILFGRSLGGTVALDLALNRSIRCLILESTFVSLKDLVKRVFPYFLFYPFLPSKFRNDEKIDQIDIPVLIIHGRADRTVPWSQGWRLYEMAKEPKEFWLVERAQHTDAFEVDPSGYVGKLRDFVLTTGQNLN